MNPLISIIVPAYNAVATLPMALSSLVAQTYSDWECIVVDDGSEDDTSIITTALVRKENRIRCVRLEKNQGRGLARQVGLEHASGQYLAMLDADDWIYPDKLKKQIDVFRLVPDIVLVSTGMAIADEKGDLAGVRYQVAPGTPLHSKPPVRMGSVPVAFAPSLIQIDAARTVGFDYRLKRAEDWDFLLRLLINSHYCILSDPTYVYNEYVSVNFENLRDTLQNVRLAIEKYRRELGLAYYWKERSRLTLRLLGYRGLFTLGFGEWLIRRRSTPPTPQDITDYCIAKETVHKYEQLLFG